jgi:hypothetical protein
MVNSFQILGRLVGAVEPQKNLNTEADRAPRSATEMD